MSVGIFAAVVNVMLAIWALVWRLKRETSIPRRAKILRWSLVAGSALIVLYANYNPSAAILVLIGGGIGVVFLFCPELADWLVRFFSKPDV
jgi:hypothetical protein